MIHMYTHAQVHTCTEILFLVRNDHHGAYAATEVIIEAKTFVSFTKSS